MSTHPVSRIAEKAKVLMGQSPPSSACSENELFGLPFIQGNAEFGWRHPTPRLRCSAPTRIAEPGDLLLSVRAPVGALNQASERIVIGRGVSALRFESADQAFAWHSVMFAAKALDVVAQGTTFVAVSRSDVEGLAIPWHGDSNGRIAAVLDAVDDAIAKTEAVIGKLRQVRAGLLHDLLTRGLDEHGQFRDPIAHPEQFQDSTLGRIPKGWEVKALEACVSAEITYGIVQAGPHLERGIPYIRTGDMSGDRLDIDQMLRTSPEIASRFRRSRVQCDEIVCAIRATVGKVLPVPPELDGANLTQGTARIAPKPEIDPTYLLWAIRSDRTQRGIAKEVKGTTFAEITLAELRKIKVPVPVRRKEQESITAVIEGVETQLRSEAEGLRKLQALKSGLVTDLLTGRVRVPEGTIPP